jgi:hypothetical protein
MMEPILHFGLAGWINKLRPQDDFFNSPPLPSQLDLVNLEVIQNVEDLAKAADFARRTNIVPKRSGAIDATTKLWETHAEVLKDMTFATEPWGQSEREAYNNAFDTLYTTNSLGFKEPSEKRILYSEYERAYNDIDTSGGPHIDLQLALTDWIAMGYKREIENALTTMTRLTLRSSIVQAQDEQSSLEEPNGLAFLHQSNRHFAPVYFSPISAVAKETWMEAEITLNDVDGSMNGTPYRAQWLRYRSGKNVTITFKYTVLDCNRPWFSPELYETDDWKVSEGRSPVSLGNGQDGDLPAYVSSVYLVSIEKVKINKTKSRSVRGNRINNALMRMPVTFASKSIRKPIKVRQALSIRRASNSATIIRAKPTLASSTMKLSYTKLDVGGQLRKISKIQNRTRFDVAAQLLRNRFSRRSGSTQEAGDFPTYIVGYGCKTIPLAPISNPHYKW